MAIISLTYFKINANHEKKSLLTKNHYNDKSFQSIKTEWKGRVTCMNKSAKSRKERI